jgi:hypothetical protein
MFCLQRVKPSFKIQKQFSPQYCEVFKAHTDPRIACGFRNSGRLWFLLQNCRQQAEVIRNHDNETVRHTGKGEAQHRKCKEA